MWCLCCACIQRRGLHTRATKETIKIYSVNFVSYFIILIFVLIAFCAVCCVLCAVSSEYSEPWIVDIFLLSASLFEIIRYFYKSFFFLRHSLYPGTHTHTELNSPRLNSFMHILIKQRNGEEEAEWLCDDEKRAIRNFMLSRAILICFAVLSAVLCWCLFYYCYFSSVMNKNKQIENRHWNVAS